MGFDGFDISLILLFMGFVAAGARFLYDEYCSWPDEDGQEGPLQLTGGKAPALPAHKGPYREPGERSGDDGSEQAETSNRLDGDELFRRFVYAYARLRGKLEPSDLRRMAEEIDAETLLNAVECDAAGSDWEQAAIFALSVRTNPDDVGPLVEILERDECVEARLAALKTLHQRGVPDERTVSAVIKCAFGEIDWESDGDGDDDEDETDEEGSSEQLQKSAQMVLDYWEEAHPEIMLDFISRR